MNKFIWFSRQIYSQLNVIRVVDRERKTIVLTIKLLRKQYALKITCNYVDVVVFYLHIILY